MQNLEMKKKKKKKKKRKNLQKQKTVILKSTKIKFKANVHVQTLNKEHKIPLNCLLLMKSFKKPLIVENLSKIIL